MAARFIDASVDASIDASVGTGSAGEPRDLDLDVARAVAALADLGITPGDRVVLSCEPSVDTVVAYLAIRAAGAVVVPANTAYTERELRHIVDDVRPALAVATDRDRFTGLVAEAVAPGALTTDGPVNLLDGVVSLARRPDDPAMIAFTSGTTGAPKGAVLSAANLDASAAAVVEAWGWTSYDVLVLALPLFHMHGLGVGVNGTVAADAEAIVLPRFDADAVFDAAFEHGATMFFGVPTMYARLAEHPRLPELGALRLCVSGSAPLPAELWHRIREGCGQEVLERYGMSETAMLTSNPLDGPRRPGTVGVPLPGVQVRLGDGDGVEVRGPNVFAGYWERPEATADAFTDDGWFRTGDVGAFDDAGHLRLVGRSSELIITGGYNVYPREVEDVVRELAGVADVAVVGVPDDTWGEQVVGFVVKSPGASISADVLDAHVAGMLASYKRPRYWNFVDALPRNAMGKVRRDVLRDGGA
jgi:malonyl-CoA/methylmalonyl-CoA synthetase